MHYIYNTHRKSRQQHVQLTRRIEAPLGVPCTLSIMFSNLSAHAKLLMFTFTNPMRLFIALLAHLHIHIYTIQLNVDVDVCMCECALA